MSRHVQDIADELRDFPVNPEPTERESREFIAVLAFVLLSAAWFISRVG